MTLIVPESDHTFMATGLIFNKTYMFEVLAISQQYGSGPSANTFQSTLPLQGDLHSLKH